MLSADALVVVERSTRSPEPTWPVGLAPVRSKKYGETTVWWAEPAGVARWSRVHTRRDVQQACAAAIELAPFRRLARVLT